MKETDKVLAEILQKAISAAETTGQFVVDQAPDLVKQLLVWTAVENAITISIGLMLIYGAWRVYEWTEREVENDNYSGWEDYPLSIGAIIFLSVFGFFGVVIPLYTIAKILLAPKVYLIEYAAILIK